MTRRPHCPKCFSRNVAVCDRRPGVFDDFRWAWLGCLDCFYRWKSRSKAAKYLRETTAEQKEKIEAALKRKTTKKVEFPEIGKEEK